MSVLRKVFASPREAAYALLAPVLGLVCGVSLLCLLAVSLVASVTQIGLILVIGTLAAARATGAMHRGLLRGLLGEDITTPPKRPRGLRSALTDADGWRAAAFTVAYAPIGLVLFTVSIGIWAYGLLGVAYPFYWWAINEDGRHGIGVAGDFRLDSWPLAFLTVLAGIAVLALGTWLTRGLLALVVRPMGRALLGPGRLESRVQELQATRALAVQDSAATLRRIERDLHDGAQARLVAVAMALAGAKDQLAHADLGDAPELTRGRELVDSALDGSRTAIRELRDLVRGIHPPALNDGLDVALETLASGYALPVTLDVDLPERPPEALETIAYFCAAELLANAAKHAAATRAEVAAYEKDGALHLSVRDDGRGGARARPGGTGLAGLSERVSTVDGRLLIDSPEGGPTTVTVELPL
ncbi:sensor histidine kinase [Streptomyces boninensis]|uniref:sensor histidine kinase n=1 Tax=Streptomyces boninensis TaxID=2039455 RepID=UPI003B219EF2